MHFSANLMERQYIFPKENWLSHELIIFKSCYNRLMGFNRYLCVVQPVDFSFCNAAM